MASGFTTLAGCAAGSAESFNGSWILDLSVHPCEWIIDVNGVTVDFILNTVSGSQLTFDTASGNTNASYASVGGNCLSANVLTFTGGACVDGHPGSITVSPV